jgi:hypothetical protein
VDHGKLDDPRFELKPRIHQLGRTHLQAVEQGTQTVDLAFRFPTVRVM